MTVHGKKIWPEYFKPVKEGRKTFELRDEDPNGPRYEVGDYLILHEWDPTIKEYTGEKVSAEIIYILDGPFKIPGKCLMSIKLMNEVRQ